MKFSIFLLLVLVPTVKALYCYVCVSDESFKDCTETQRKQECPYENGRCDYQYLEYTDSQGKRVMSYAKGCSHSSQCSSNTRLICKETEQKYKGAVCEVTCCSGGICNEKSGSIAVTSGVLWFLACAVAILANAH